MRVRYLSDIHLEFIKKEKFNSFISSIKPNIDEICILAGDIGNPYSENYNMFMKYISNSFKKTFVITGNHEYYNNDIIETNNYLNSYFNQFNNISFLNNKIENYNNYCFIGSTMWTKITNPNYEINDVNYIKNFTYNECNNLNNISVKFIEESLNNNSNCIVITHHLPSYKLIDSKYKTKVMENYNQWFYCDMDHLIEGYNDKIKCWIYGHTHTRSNVIINNIPFLCNPIGYPNENININFKSNIELDV